MLPALTRASFWLAALAAALALAAPDGHRAVFAGLAAFGMLGAFGLWRSALAIRKRTHATTTDGPPDPPPITENSLLDAAAMIVRACHEAASFDTALLAVARLLKNELGARAATSHAVLGVDERHARIAEVMEARAALHGPEQLVPVGASPVGEAAAPAPAPAAPADISVLTLDANRHILVVEDNVGGQEATAPVLRALGARVQVASTMLEGLYALCETQFDVVLLDMRVPGMGGVEALNFFRQGTSAGFRFVTPSDTPVVALLANPRPGDEERLLGAGFDGMLGKPLRRSRLLAMLNQRLRLLAPVSANDSPAAGMPTRRGSAAPPALLDPVSLGRLIELDPTGENRLLQRVFDAFCNSAARMTPQLRESRRTREMTGIRHVAHTLKSSAGSIGALKLSQCCADIETMIRTDKLQDLDACIDGMESELAVVLKALRQFLDGAP